MEVIFIRSPYFIEVDEASQAGSKIELFIWNKGTTEPATATYTLSKKAASATQTGNIYNISSYVKEFIDIIKPTFVTTPTEEEDTNWCYVKVKRYTSEDNIDFDLLDTTTYVALNGYTNYLDGYNSYNDDNFIPLTIAEENNKIYKYYNTVSKPYLNFYINYIDDADTYEVKYTSFDTLTVTANTILDSATIEEYVFKVPITVDDVDYAEGNKMDIIKNGDVVFTYIFTNECEPKYTPMLCSFINRLGGWEYITFFKAKTETWEVKNKEYQLLPDDIDYNIYRGQSKFFNYEAKKSVKINTGWVDEAYNELIKDLMTSETILLDNVPVKLKTMSTDLKTSLQDKMINYQVEFEYNFNQINNVI